MKTLEYFDVLIVCAGPSGIGAGVHLQKHCPDRSFAIPKAASPGSCTRTTRDILMLRYGKVDDGVMAFGNPARAGPLAQAA